MVYESGFNLAGLYGVLHSADGPAEGLNLVDQWV